MCTCELTLIMLVIKDIPVPIQHRYGRCLVKSWHRKNGAEQSTEISEPTVQDEFVLFVLI